MMAVHIPYNKVRKLYTSYTEKHPQVYLILCDVKTPILNSTPGL